MKKRCLFLIVCVFLSVIGFAQPKNIILVMADGVGYNHAKIMYDNNGCVLSEFPVQYAVCNYPTYWKSYEKGAPKDVNFFRGDYHVRRVWEEFDYADSLPIDPITAGSALATGVKPAVDAVSFDMDGRELKTIIERAIEKGKATGLATDTIIISNNAVLPFVSHAMVANTEELYQSLFTQVFKSDINLVINSTNMNPGNSNETWTYSNSLDEFPTSLDKKVAFGKEALSTVDYATASTKGLDALATNENGFLFVAEYTKAARAAEKQDVDATISAMEAFNDYVSALYNWIEEHNGWDETLMIIVGSYEQGYLTSKSFDKKKPVSNYLSASSDDIMYNSEYATNLLTPLFAKGAGATIFDNFIDETDFVLGSYISNTEIPQAIFRLWKDEITMPKNIIFMVNDGCGIAPIMMADFYTGKKASFEDFPVQLWNCTHASATKSYVNNLSEWNNSYESRLAWTGKNYFWKHLNATCSGASATAMASGKKTYYYSLGVDVNKNAMKSIAIHAKGMGKSAGVATNAPYNDATPGAFFTNNVSRLNSGELARQVVIESITDVVIGCDHPEYDTEAQKLDNPEYDKIGGKEILDGLRANATTFDVASNSGWNTVRDIDGDGTPDPWTFVEDSAGLVQYLYSETVPKRLFAVMPVEGSMQFYRRGINPQEVHFDDWNAGMPKLWQIGRTAINCLSKNENGFFVMIEGDMVDNSGHKNQAGRHIEEQMEFNQTVDSVIAWIEKYSSWDETLLIVTADHETGFVADPTFKEDSILLNHWQIIDNGVGNMPGVGYYSLDHTNQLVPLYAKGAGSELLNRYADEWDYVRGKYLNNSEIGQAMFELWNGTACQFANQSPKQTFFDTVFVKQSTDFSVTLPKDMAYDVEEGILPVNLVSKPLWVNVSENDGAIVLSGTAPKRTGVSLITFSAIDGETTGAAISLEFSLKVCVYKDTEPEAVETISESTSNVYPTFALTGVTVRSETGNGTILVRNLQGKIVKSIAIQGEKTEVETADLTSGEYLIQIIENENVITKKIIVR